MAPNNQTSIALDMKYLALFYLEPTQLNLKLYFLQNNMLLKEKPQPFPTQGT